MPQHAYSANLISQFGPSKKYTPDTFYFDEASPRPSDDFVISRTIEGKPLSKYGDDIWDLRPYRTTWTNKSARVDFSIAEGTVKEEAKWLIFLLLYAAASGRATGLAISTVMTHWDLIRRLVLHSKDRAICIRDIIENENDLIRFVSSHNKKDKLRYLSNLFFHLLDIPSEVSGYHVLGAARFEIVEKKLKLLGDAEQHPVIPPRIYFNLIQQLESFVSEIYTHKNQLFRFLKKILESKNFGRCIEYQYLLGYSSKGIEPAFREASELYGLSGLFKKYGVRSTHTLTTFLNKIQHGCRLQIHIYTGMRQGEALSLKVGALHSVKRNMGSSYKFIGETSKLVGQKKIVSWVTSKEVIKGYKMLKGLAEIAGKFIKIKKTEVPLFISMSYLGLGNNHHYDGIQITTASAAWKKKRFMIYWIVLSL